MKKIIFCVNGNKRIGMGHVGRCLALSDHLKRNLATDIIYFMEDSEEGKGSVCSHGYEVVEVLPEDKVDVIVTSLTRMSDEYMRMLKGKTQMLVCLDDSDRTRFEADLVVRGSIVPELRQCEEYTDVRFLLSKDYMLLDQTFQEFHSRDKEIRPDVKSVLVAMGGSDINHFTETVLNALENMAKKGFEVTVVVGPAFKDANQLMQRPGFHFKYDVSNMAELMYEADMIIAGGGMILYELACVGTPGIVLSQTDYQLLEAQCFEQEGIIIHLGEKKDISKEGIVSEVESLMRDQKKRKDMSLRGKSVIDGQASDRIVNTIKEGMQI